MTAPPTPEFTTTLWKYPGGNWVFANIPDMYAPPVTLGWGRTPVVAALDGHTWKTSVWRGNLSNTSSHRR